MTGSKSSSYFRFSSSKRALSVGDNCESGSSLTCFENCLCVADLFVNLGVGDDLELSHVIVLVVNI